MWGRSFKARMLMERFGVSRQQVGLDFSLYMRLCPENVQPYDPANRAYLPKAGFTPRLSSNTDSSEVENSVVEKIPIINRTNNPKTLSSVLSAIQECKAIEFIYGSASMPIGRKRTVVPVRVISTSNRLHFRGYCTEKLDFRDFTISRCLTIPKIKQKKIDLPPDRHWEEEVEVTLVVNPALGEDGQRLIAEEYGDSLNKVIRMPGPTLHYFLIDNNFPAVEHDYLAAKKKPWAFPIIARYVKAAEYHLFG